MKAAVVGSNGVEVRDVEQPKPGPAQVLVRVRAAGLNRADLIMASGRMHGPTGGAGTVLGLECAGEVVAFGTEVTGLKAGDRVLCSAAGCYAEYAVADFGRVHKIPANNMTYPQAATLPPVGEYIPERAFVTIGLSPRLHPRDDSVRPRLPQAACGLLAAWYACIVLML